MTLGVAKVCDLIWFKAPTMGKKDKAQAIRDCKRVLQAAEVLNGIPPVLRRKLDSC